MKLKPYFYEEPDGIHYPDARVGADYVYGMDFTEFLESEKGKLKTVEWYLENGLVKGENWINEMGSIAYIKIGSPYVGSFTVKAKMTYISMDVEQSINVPLIVKVL